MEAIKELWFLIAAFVSLVVWFVRLEAKSNQNGRDLSKLESRLGQQRAEDMARIEKTMGEVAQDVKTLLARRD